jgi:hypothetical protein
MPIVEIVAALLFVGSSGLFFNERFRKNRVLIAGAGIIALVSTYFLTVEIVNRAMPSQQETSSEFIEMCARAEVNWAQLRESEDMSLLRTLLTSTPERCGVERAEIAQRIADLEAARREAARAASNRMLQNLQYEDGERP